MAFAIRETMNDIDEAPGKVWFWDLEQAVIDPGRCVECGACVGACPSDSIGVADDGLPMLVKMCTGCSLCWDFCPRGGLRYEATWKMTGADRKGRPIRETYTARVRAPMVGQQDGGVVSAMLIHLLEAGEIDGALVARASATEPWKGEAFLAKSPGEVRSCAGSFYNQTMGLAHIDPKQTLPPSARIAVVGTPCEVQALRAMQSHPWSWGSSRAAEVTLTIALLCTKSFDYRQLMVRGISEDCGIDLGSVGKVDVTRGRLLVFDHEGGTLLDEPIKDFHQARLKGCDECGDFLGRAADVSVGSVGSVDGYSSVLIRSEAGRRAWGLTQDRLEVRELDHPAALDKLDALDKRTALETLHRDFDPEGPLFIDLDEHERLYGGTDRSPVTHDPVRY